MRITFLRRKFAVVATAGALIALSACATAEPEKPASPPPTSESTSESPAPDAISNAGEEVPVGPGETIPYYDFDQSFDEPPHVADIRITGVEWDWAPPEDTSQLCEYDPANGRYIAVQLEIDSNGAARSSGTPFSGEDFVITDDAGEPAAEYRSWDTIACPSPNEEITVSLEPNSHYEGAFIYVVDEDASQLRLDYHFDNQEERVAPIFVWTLAAF